MMGYIVKFQGKTSLFFREKPGDNYTETKQALLGQEELARMLIQPFNYLVLSAHLVNMKEYRLNHPEETFEAVNLK